MPIRLTNQPTIVRRAIRLGTRGQDHRAQMLQEQIRFVEAPALSLRHRVKPRGPLLAGASPCTPDAQDVPVVPCHAPPPLPRSFRTSPSPRPPVWLNSTVDPLPGHYIACADVPEE